MTIIKSIRDTLNVDYKRPDENKVVIFQDSLNNTPSAMEYLKTERGLTNETINHFNLGYDGKRDAISIPIYKNGELINIKYRFLHPKTIKYSSEKGAEIWLYNDEGLDIGLKKEGILIVEGEFDLMSVWQSGIRNVVSPSAGKNAYGMWIERIDNIPRVWIAYDNDKGGKETSFEIAERLGVDKSYELVYPDGIKDANEFFRSHTKDDFKELIKSAKPYYTYQFKGLGDIIEGLRNSEKKNITTWLMPNVNMDKDWLVMVSARRGAGKTSYTLNVVNDLEKQGHSVLFLPVENGVDFVGKRLLSILCDKTFEDFTFFSEEDWERLINDIVDRQIFFAQPKTQDVLFDTILKSRRYFNTQVVVIDLLEYVVNDGTDENSAMNQLVKRLKIFAFEHKILIFAVAHVRKDDRVSAIAEREPTLSDIKGTGSLTNYPHCVVLLHPNEEGLKVIVAKNKGRESSETFEFKEETGLIVGKTQAQKDYDDF